MAVLEQQHNATTKFESMDAHVSGGKKPEADPFSDVRDGGKLQAMKDEKAAMLAIIEKKKMLPDLQIDGAENTVKGGGKPNGGKGKADWLDCIKPAPDKLSDGLTFDSDKVVNQDGGAKIQKGGNQVGGTKTEKEPNHDGGVKTQKEPKADGGVKSNEFETLL